MSLKDINNNLGRKLTAGDFKKTLGFGQKYSHFGSRSGNASILDQKTIVDNAEKHQLDKMSYRIQYLDKNGNIIENPTINHNGRVIGAREGTNSIVFADAGALEYRRNIEKERDEAVTQIANYCIFNDDLAMEVLGLHPEEYRDLMVNKNNVNIPESLRDASASADYLNALAKGSKERALGIARLRYVIKHFCPVALDGQTKTEKLVEADDEGKL